METATPIPVQLKATSLSELLDHTFTLYRNNFWLVCGIMVLPEAILLPLTLVHTFVFPIRIIPMAHPDPSNPFAALAGMQSSMLATFALLFFRIAVYALTFGCMTFAVSEIYLGHGVTIRQAYASVAKRIFGLLGLILMLGLIGIVLILVTSIVVGIAGALLGGALMAVSPVLMFFMIIISFIGGFILGFWVLMRFSICIPVFVLERRGVFDSMTRSGALTKGHRWRIFVACLVMLFIVYAVQLLFTTPFAILIMSQAIQKGVISRWVQIANAISIAVSAVLSSPIMMIVLSLIYYDVRIRKEAFDLELMMNTMGPPTGSPPSPGTQLPYQPAQ